jgi:hypothetical protein
MCISDSMDVDGTNFDEVAVDSTILEAHIKFTGLAPVTGSIALSRYD